jgi:Tol biopolymer transport system component
MHAENMGTRRTIGMVRVMLGVILSSCALLPGSSEDVHSGSDPLLYAGEEAVLARARQLTFEGQNAEAYFAPDDGGLVFQATPESLACDQIFTMRIDGSDKRRVSTGEGVTTCGYFLYPEGDSLLFSSTHEAGASCPPRPDYSRGYVWPIHPGYDVFVAASDGSGLRRLTTTSGYDAEATMSRDGSRIVFTSVRDGDLEIYTMARNGTDVRRLTNEPGYDGGAFFSYDGTKIVYRAHHPETPVGLLDYRALLGENLVRPSRMEIWIMDADGSDKRQLTDNGAANFAPYFFPDGRRIVFASNMHDPGGRNFDLYAIDADGAHLTRLTTHPEFDAFPMFSSDGRLLVWASNRNAAKPGDTNIFVADWVGHIPPP